MIFFNMWKLPLILMIIASLLSNVLPKDLAAFFSGKTREELALSGGSPWADSDLKENISFFRFENPQDDFHYYADKELLCENRLWGYENWNIFAERMFEIEDQVLEIVKDDSLKSHDADLVQTMYGLLTDWDKRDKTSIGEIKEITDKILDTKDLDELTELLCTRQGAIWFDNFIGIFCEQGKTDSEHYAVYITPYLLRLEDSAEYKSRSEYGEMTAAYKDEMFVYTAGRLGMDKTKAEEMLKQAYELEDMLAPYIPTSEEQMSAGYVKKSDNEMTYKDIKKLSGDYPLTDIIEAMGYTFDGTYIVSEPEYLKELNSIYIEENFERIKSLIYIDAVNTFIEYADRDIYDKDMDVYEECYGYVNRFTDDEMAYYKLGDILYEPLQKLYVDRYGSEEDKRKLENICRDVIGTYRKMLSENTWASEETRDYAIKKLDQMEIHIAWPDEFRDNSELSFEGLSLIESLNAIYELDLKRDNELAGTVRDPDDWGNDTNLLDVNAYYSPANNAICMPIGMMGKPFFSEDMSKEELYASIAAFWLGHEISHSFDSNGSQYDADGNLRDWWKEEDKREFDKRIDKLSDYLDGIVPFGSYHVTGSSIDTEMAADMTGLQCALRMAEYEPDFDYKVFFRKYAELNASIMPYGSELENLLQDPHPLSYLRTNVPLQQFEEFYETYDVREGDAMYLAPEDRLIIW